MSAVQEQRPSQVGRYRLLELLGEGAQGCVYVGHDPTLGRDVAVKLVRGNAQDGGFGITEARAVARLQHPGIASIYDVGRHEDWAYLVFELVPGRSLAEVLRADGVPPRARALHVMTQVLAGVAHAHSQGVAHLDLKPGNVAVTGDGKAKVLDFGLAQMLRLGQGDLEMVGGTPRYMAPEHFDCSGLGPFTDVFALGLVLFEMLVGRPVVEVRSFSAMGQALRCEALDLTPLVAAGVDGALVKVVARALSIPRAQRFANAVEMAQAMAEAAARPASASEAGGSDAGRAVDFVMRRLRSRGELPALSKAVMDVNRLTSESSDATVADIANVVMRDQALTTRLLRLANSALYSTQQKASKVTDAISRIGFAQVRFTASALGYFDALNGEDGAEALRDAVLKSFLAGLIARHLAQRIELDEVEEAFLCGMLFDTGQHLVMHCMPEEHTATEERMARAELGDDEEALMLASRDVLGVDYAHIGAVVAESWELPGEIVAAIGARGEEAGGLDPPADALAQLAAMANELAWVAGNRDPEQATLALNSLTTRHAARVPMDDAAAAGIAIAAAKKMQRFAPALGVSVESSAYLRALTAWVEAEPVSRSA